MNLVRSQIGTAIIASAMTRNQLKVAIRKWTTTMNGTRPTSRKAATNRMMARRYAGPEKAVASFERLSNPARSRPHAAKSPATPPAVDQRAEVDIDCPMD